MYICICKKTNFRQIRQIATNQTLTITMRLQCIHNAFTDISLHYSLKWIS